MAGCFIIGVLSFLADTRGVFTTETRTLVFVGVLGGFTTFSSFGNETFNLLRDGENASAMVNVAIHIVLGIALVWVGRTVSYLIWG